MPQLNGGGGDDLGANDELISFKDEGEQEEKSSENSSAERDLADVKSSLVNESETNQNSSSDSELHFQSGSTHYSAYKTIEHQIAIQQLKEPDSDLHVTGTDELTCRKYTHKTTCPMQSRYGFDFDLRGSVIVAFSVRVDFYLLTDFWFPSWNLVSLSASQGPGDGHSLVGTQPFCGIELQRDGEVGAVTAEWLLLKDRHQEKEPCGFADKQLDSRVGIPRPPHPPDISPYYPLSPGTVGQIPHPLGWQGQPVYPITTGGFRHPYPTALTVNASMSRFPPHMVPPHHTLHTTGIPHPAIVTPTVKQESSQSDVGSLHSAKHQDSKKEEEKKKPHIKKPLNAFMLYMKEMRAKVVAECTLKESAAINQILGRRWHALSREEQAKYYELARKERQLHMQLYPGWSARDNYGKKKKRKRDKQPGETNDANTPKKCRALFGLDRQTLWCKPCRRKKKCVRYIQGEGSCLSPPSSDGSLLDSPPSSPNLLGSPPQDAKSQTEQTQPLSLSLKPDPLAHLSMMPPPPALLLAEAAHGKAPALCANGALDLPPAALQPPAIPPSSLAQPSTSSLHSHGSLAGTQPQPLSLVTKSLE
ncbi:hypothetical protein G4228_010847 [Cervus hanglu yarkandensis]|nr:hypothetical protein G4228_010847 [Cervus hanglu yarkandensis]